MKKFRRMVIACAALAAVIPLAVGSVFANSDLVVEERYDSSGVLVASGEKSVLEVESEKLYFDVTSFPSYNNEEDYKSTVTAEYHFLNPTQETVKTKMGFLAGSIPYYFNDMTKFAPKVYKDETEIEVTTRHTYNGNGWSDKFAGRLDNLSDDFYEDAFYNKDLAVTPYKFTYGSDTEEAKTEWEESNRMYVRYFADLALDKTKTRYISNSYSDSADIMFYNAAGEGYLYVLGEDNFDTLSFSAESINYNGRREKLTEVPVTVEKHEPITLKDLLLKKHNEESGINEVDWFNAVMSTMSLTSVSPITVNSLSYFNSADFTAWYVYELELAPGERAVNSVVSPIFPRYFGSGCEYRYYLSPAKSWASFGSLEVVIRTKFSLGSIYTIDDENVYYGHNYQDVAGGYKVFFDKLPDGELEFNLYEYYSYTEKPGVNIDLNYLGMAVLIIIIIVSVLPYVIGVTVAIVILIKNSKNKKNMR